MKGKRGISLIVLVITIIMIIILAVAVILSIANNNPIENARNANDDAVFKEALDLYLGQYILDTNLGKIDPNTKTAQEYVKEELRVQGFPEEKIDLIVINDTQVEIVTKEVADFIKERDPSLIYSSGFITGLTDKENESKMYTKERLLTKLPEGASILNYKGEEMTTENIGTGCQILDKDGNIIAHTIFFGDGSCDGRVNMKDYSMLKIALNAAENGNIKDSTIEEYKSQYGNWYNFSWGDVNGDKKIDVKDYDLILESIDQGNVPDTYCKLINQFRTVIKN